MKTKFAFFLMAIYFFNSGIAYAQQSDSAICRSAHDFIIYVNSVQMAVSENQGKNLWRAVSNSCSVNRSGNSYEVIQSYQFINQKTRQPMGNTVKYRMKLVYANNMNYLCELHEDTFGSGKYENRKDDFRRNAICGN